jgi:hypothetical protein
MVACHGDGQQDPDGRETMMLFLPVILIALIGVGI